ncbi:adhesion G-protein coupled receptor G2-like [Xiphophorus maculatus]|uniref:adhesion G-protein coupled receptor G2-like n=1 Tax=Xiphophorus maculatus TaxID=8083 RepID=UPI000C6E86B2|nr:adhesion G-protein coupled receptor G2-like [Xiphophorus maculatus]
MRRIICWGLWWIIFQPMLSLRGEKNTHNNHTPPTVIQTEKYSRGGHNASATTHPKGTKVNPSEDYNDCNGTTWLDHINAELKAFCSPPPCQASNRVSKNTTSCFMRNYTQDLKMQRKNDEDVKTFQFMENVLEETEVTNETHIHEENIMAFLHKPASPFKGLNISANDNEVTSGVIMPNRSVLVHLPQELNLGEENTVVFSMIQLPKEAALERSDELYDRRLLGLSVRGKNISGLQERVNITINFTTSINENLRPVCVFLNTTTQNFSVDGCVTLWDRSQSHVTCSCDHLTYFGVLLVSHTFTSNGSVSYGSISSRDAEILSYITYIGCGISLFALVITVLMFTVNRKLRADDSKKIHISLAVALILLNVHFLPSQAAAASSSTELCLYVALLLHYSLLASFTWMALEGFHLYLLLVKVFNVYVRRYLLKLSVVGWGLPAVIVSVVAIINKDIYGRTSVDLSNPNGTALCYITEDKVKMGTTVGLFSLMFLFNLIMFGITVKWFVGSHDSKERKWSGLKNTKREIVTLLLLLVLLGLTWGVIFFSFGDLTTPALYAFCILNPLQGFFIFIYFVLSLKKTKDTSSETHTTQT